MLQKVIDLLLGVPPALALVIIAALVFGEAALFFGFVLPGETAVVYGGVLADAGKVSVVLVLLVVIVAAVVGDSVGFEPPCCAATPTGSRPPRSTCAGAEVARS